MQEETKQTLATVTLKSAIKSVGKENVNQMTLSEHLSDELPGLDGDIHAEVLAYALRLLPHVAVRVDVDTAMWKLQEEDEMSRYSDGLVAGDPGAIW